MDKGYILLYFDKNKTFFKIAYSPTLQKKETKYSLEYWNHFRTDNMKSDKEIFTKMFNEKYQRLHYKNYIVYKMKPEYYDIDDPVSDDGPLCDLYRYYEDIDLNNNSFEDRNNSWEDNEIQIAKKKLIELIHNKQKVESKKLLDKFDNMKKNILKIRIK